MIPKVYFDEVGNTGYSYMHIQYRISGLHSFVEKKIV